ncbi:MAG: hypothetical protein JWN03_3204 [Nocardia sp.]|uniref:MaoC family dehydratase n=1 Tax=Nocardia sp. TaxID=1821 RepID=UPI00263056FA|nr:MaoC family dehydratase [Nocardia sp.]MCU1642929.1 hypothetical protein [Nocardia sp.]
MNQIDADCRREVSDLGYGPFFEDLVKGQVFDSAPAVTLTDGLATAHRMIVGTRLRLPLDATLGQAVTSHSRPLADPSLVWDLAIGQSTVVTRHVKANLFYRGLRFHRFPHIGDTLHSRTEVVGLRQNAPKPGRPPTGMAALRITTTDQDGIPVLDFYRCAMLSMGDESLADIPGAVDDLSNIGPRQQLPFASPPSWDLREFRARVPGQHFAEDLVGARFSSTGDVVGSAPELARLTLNIAAVHHDSRISEAGRLVYGGHTIALALAQTTRALPNLVTVLGWHRCDHVGPVREGDTLYSEVRVDSAAPSANGVVVNLSAVVHADRPGAEQSQVLRWQFAALMA